MNRDEWLARRKMVVGGSDIAKIAGLSPYGGPLDVYLDKLSLIPDQPVNFHMKRGIALEPVILETYAEQQGVDLEVLQPYTLYESGFCGGTPDGLVVGGERGVEAKAPLYATGYGEPGTDEVPEPHLVQCAWYMMLTDREAWDLAATIGGGVEIFHILRNLDLQAALREMAEKFWRDHIIPQRPPAVDGSESSRAWLRQQFPENRRPLLEPTEEALELIGQYRRLKPYFDDQEKALEAIKSRLMQIIGDADGIQGVATWKKAKDRMKTDWKAVAEELALVYSVDREYFENLSAEATITEPGARRFVYTNSNGRKKS